MFYKAVQHIKRNDNSMTTVADIETIDQYVKPIILDDFIQKTENKYPKIYEIFDYYIIMCFLDSLGLIAFVFINEIAHN